VPPASARCRAADHGRSRRSLEGSFTQQAVLAIQDESHRTREV
jgi:hypothetical protein